MKINVRRTGFKTLIIKNKDFEWKQLFDILIKSRKKRFANHLLKHFVYELEEKTIEPIRFNKRIKYSDNDLKKILELRNKKKKSFPYIAKFLNMSNRQARNMYACAKQNRRINLKEKRK